MPIAARQVTLAIAGLVGAAGVGLAAAAAHAPKLQGTDHAAMLLVLHAAAAIGTVASSLHFERRALFRVATLLMLAGAVLFAASIVMLALYGVRLFPMSAPIGGSAMIAGWLVLALAALTGRPDRS